MKPRIVFFGSGPVAARSLELLSAHCDIEAVITKPKPEKHRGEFPVLLSANKLGLPTYTPANKAELDALFDTTSFTSRVGVVIDYGIIISQRVIDAFERGIVNSHFSLLPQWRGADPITFALLSGQEKTGVSIMRITAGLDEGPIIAYGVYEIPPQETIDTLTEGLIYLSDALLKEQIPRYLERGRTVEQLEAARQIGWSDEISYSRKLTKEDGRIDWSKPAEVLEREIRAYLQWPKSYTALGGLDVVITKARVADGSDTPGTARINGNALLVACGKKSLEILTLKPAGKKEMTAQAFLAGYRKLFT